MAIRKGKHVNKSFKNGRQLIVFFFVVIFLVRRNVYNENQIVKMKWNNATKKYYKQLGYQFTKNDGIFEVKAKDLLPRSEIKIEVKCDYCNTIKQMPKGVYFRFTDNNTKKYRCRNCFYLQHNVTYQQVLDVCNNNGYELCTDFDKFKNGQTYIEYKCPKHGIQRMKANNMIIGRKCPKCNHDNANLRYKLSEDEVIKRIKEFDGTILNPDEYVNQVTKNLKIVCPCCGNIFLTSIRNFTQHKGQICEKCSGKESRGEKKIRHFLEGNNIEFIAQKWFPDCRDERPLPFDFYLPDNNMIVEFDGRQHFEEVKHFTYSYEKVREHDSIKNNYCKDKNIKLIRIPYWDIDKVEEILQQKIS